MSTRIIRSLNQIIDYLVEYRPDFKIRADYSQSYKQIGNSIAIPVVEAITKKILENL